MDNLSKLRKNIDACDKELVDIFRKRFSLVKKVADYKKEKNVKLLDKSRWKEVLTKTASISRKKGLSVTFMKSIMNLTHKEALRVERIQSKGMKNEQ